MDWNKLLCADRRKDKHGGKGHVGTNTGKGRAEIERDYDRILFCTPVRRLADKTQVFPLERNDSVRTRLTHSHEVSNLARGIGVRLAFEHKEIFGETSLCIERDVPALLASIGLVHDLGNPPFGHQGEAAIQKWFENNKEAQPKDYSDDFLKFDGNSQTFRLITKLQILNDQFGLNLTYATLVAMLKYPVSSANVKNSTVWKKHGFFISEQDIVQDLWENTGLSEGKRHPLTYIMEACDDIAYSVLDAEDIVKKSLASFYDLVNYLEYWANENCQQDEVILDLIEKIKNKNAEYKKENLSPAELNDMSMQMFRVFSISSLVNNAVDTFLNEKDKFINIKSLTKDLIGESKGKNLCKALKSFDTKWGYQHKSVLKLELEGYNYIQSLMDMLWIGIHGKLTKTHKSQTPFGKYAYQKISENYRRVFEDNSNTMDTDYKEAQLLTDAISGMTDSYLIDIHNELIALKNDFTSTK
ncbi:dNTP triphosphohydrolase [Alteromonas stellipolaris]|uniref:dGTP triphosphohydrolase n=1 Tax=Alteromonas stellipolaris TaxID=233316 RepID=UPI0026E17046|nr:dNTP triphosphohydrolase [Alteromonas stellipolaris]MDO6537414.1 dNTP triphosphohydrolase [Alteromonas stellipolaris]